MSTQHMFSWRSKKKISIFQLEKAIFFGWIKCLIWSYVSLRDDSGEL